MQTPGNVHPGKGIVSSYAPEAGHPGHEPLLAGLARVFAAHQEEGRVLFPYVTLVYFARMKAS